MSILLFAVEAIPPLSYPWWLTNALVPAGIAILGSLIALGGSWLLARRTELYRRLARWEPYSEHLWARQVELYGELCAVADEAVPAAYEMVWNQRSENPDNHKLFMDIFHEKTQKMRTLSIRANILLSPEFNKAYANFAEEYFVFANNAPIVYANAASRTQASKDYEAIVNGYVKLVDAARKSLGIDALDDQTREAILGTMKEKEEPRQPHSLPSP